MIHAAALPTAVTPDLFGSYTDRQVIVVPAQAGIHTGLARGEIINVPTMDPRLRGDDGSCMLERIASD
jgi:hypothetical protein